MTYFGVTISVGCLATSLPTVLSSLEIKWFWEVTCQHYLCAACAFAAEADGSHASAVSGRTDLATKVCLEQGQSCTSDTF